MTPSSDTVAVVAIIAGAVVGIGAPIVTARSQRKLSERQFDFERGETDTRELREILDQIADDLHGSNSTAVALPTTISIIDDDDVWMQSVYDASGGLGSHESAILAQLQRLGLRLGGYADPMINTALEACNGMRELAQLLWEPRAGNTRDEIAALQVRIQNGRNGFLDAARTFTKARLPGVQI